MKNHGLFWRIYIVVVDLRVLISHITQESALLHRNTFHTKTNMKFAKFSVLLLIFFIFPLAFAQLKNGFYSQSCSNAETIVQGLVSARFGRDPSITAALTRMHFHDCFVQV